MRRRDDLAREPIAIVVAVLGRHRRQHDEPRSDRPDDATVDADRGLAHALDQRAHVGATPIRAARHFLTALRSTSVTVPFVNVIEVIVSGSPGAGM